MLNRVIAYRNKLDILYIQIVSSFINNIVKCKKYYVKQSDQIGRRNILRDKNKDQNMLKEFIFFFSFFFSKYKNVERIPYTRLC